MAATDGAAFIDKVNGALADLDQRLVAQHKAIQDLGMRLQVHEGQHDPYMAKTDVLESTVKALQVFAGENKANIDVLRGQLDQSALAPRLNKVEEASAAGNAMQQKINSDLATVFGQVKSLYGQVEVVSGLVADVPASMAILDQDIQAIGADTINVRLGILDN